MQNFGNFGNFCDIFFKNAVSIEKCPSVQIAFSVSLVGYIFFPTQKMDVGFEIFHIFEAKKDLFWAIFGPHLFSGRRPAFFDSPIFFECLFFCIKK